MHVASYNFSFSWVGYCLCITVQSQLHKIKPSGLMALPHEGTGRAISPRRHAPSCPLCPLQSTGPALDIRGIRKEREKGGWTGREKKERRGVRKDHSRSLKPFLPCSQKPAGNSCLHPADLKGTAAPAGIWVKTLPFAHSKPGLTWFEAPLGNGYPNHPTDNK